MPKAGSRIALAWVGNVACRILLGATGLGLVVCTIPVAIAAWLALAAEPALDEMRKGHIPSPQSVSESIALLDRAIRWEDTGRRRLDLAALMAISATRTDVAISRDDRLAHLREAERHLLTGLARAPVDGAGWLRLAAVREELHGMGHGVAAALVMSIRTAPIAPRLWSTRLDIILRAVGSLSPAQIEIVSDHVRTIWKGSSNRTMFALAIQRHGGELFIRYALRDQQGAQEELTELVRRR